MLRIMQPGSHHRRRLRTGLVQAVQIQTGLLTADMPGTTVDDLGENASLLREFHTVSVPKLDLCNDFERKCEKDRN